MKLLRRGASARRKTAEGAPGGVTGGPWRAAKVTTSQPQVVTVKKDTGCTSPSLEYMRSRPALVWLLLVVVGLLVVGIVLPVALGSSTEENDPNNTLPGGHRIISKRQWGGRPTRRSRGDRPPFALNHPTPYVIISHTGDVACFDITSCTKRCRTMQDYNMDTPKLNLADIAFNFMVGGDGNVYEGRGWDITNTRGSSGDLVFRNNVDVSFMGNFMVDRPTEAQLEAAMQLLDLGVKLGKLATDYQLFAHNDTNKSFPLSPGKNIVVHIKNWPHFTNPNVLSLR